MLLLKLAVSIILENKNQNEAKTVENGIFGLEIVIF